MSATRHVYRAFVAGALLLGAPRLDAAPRPTPAPERSDRRVVVSFRDTPAFEPGAEGRIHAADPALDRALARFNVEFAERLFPRSRPPETGPGSPLGGYYLLRARAPIDVEDALRTLRALPSVASAEADGIARPAETAAVATRVPNDPAFETLQWPLRNTGTQTLDPTSLPIEAGADIRAAEAWDATIGDPAVLVAVIDTGVRLDHPEFAGRIDTNAGEIPGNGLDDDGNGYVDDVHGYDFTNPATPDPVDDSGHGTAVASVIGATGDNGRQMAGIDWRCRLLPIKVIGSNGTAFLSHVAAAIVYATDRGARVINLSLGGYGVSTALEAACAYAHDRGVVIVAAMMNDDTSEVAYPAGFDASVVAVGSTDPRDDRCRPEICGYGPNYGPHIDVVAPGVSVPILWFADVGTVVSGAGTSFAAPMVAGAASLLLARHPSLTADQARDLLRFSAVDGVGRPEEDTPGFDVYHGFGRLDAAGALALADVVHFPAIDAPPLVRAAEGETIGFEVEVRDADGDPVDSLWMDRGSLPAAASFLPSADRARGSFAWTPRYLDAGSYPVAFRATNPFLAEARTTIEVVDVPDPPVVVAPTFVVGVEGAPVAFDVAASDPDGDPLVSLAAETLPDGAAFTTVPGFGGGRFEWTPGYRQAGGYPVRFVARSLDPEGPLGTPLIETGDAKTFVRIEEGPDQAPIVAAAASVEGAEGEALLVPFAVDDPDGDEIVRVTASPLPAGAVLAVDASKRAGSISWTPGYAQAGSYVVVVSAESAHRATPVSEPVLSTGSATIAISIADRETPPLAASVEPDPGDRVLRLLAAKPIACLRLEPVAGSFHARDVDPASLRLRRADRGGTEPIAFLDAKGLVLSDRDRDGVEELGACVSKEALRSGLDDLPPGRRSVPFVVEGRLVTGEALAARFDWTVLATGRDLTADLAPSPLRGEGSITLRLPAPGPLRVRIFDVAGRLVRVLLEEARADAGYRDIPLDGRDGRGLPLRSGVYFYRVESAGASFTGKIAIAR